MGLVTGACLADVGNQVVCLDTDKEKIARLEQGHIPIYEPGLEALVKQNHEEGRLQFTTDVPKSVAHGEIQIIAVGTPPDQQGAADLSYVYQAAEQLGRYMTEPKIVVDKSTVPVGTAEQVRKIIQETLHKRGVSIKTSVVSNPEFLKEGAAVNDFMKPERVVIGTDPKDTWARDRLNIMYAPFQRNHQRVLYMDIRSAELTKYAANAMLATRISFMNELAGLAERLGADIELVRQGIGSDSRIGHHFLYPGCGYGGSCFPKDVQALQRTARNADYPLRMIAAVEEVNESQKHVLAKKIVQRFPQIKGMRFAVWGLSFKPNTDDMREAPSLTLIEDLLSQGAHLCLYDPIAIPETRRLLGEHQSLSYASSMMDALKDADALVVVTEWKAFRSPDFTAMRQYLKQAIIFDGRNLYSLDSLKEAGYEYYPIGRPAVTISSLSH